MESDHESAQFAAVAVPTEPLTLDIEVLPPPAGDALVVERLAPVVAGEGAADAAADAERREPATADSTALDRLDELSPAVRRLVRQYQLDVSSVRGTGPAGRIRVGDVIGLLGRGDGSGDGSRPSGAPAIAEQRSVDARVARVDERDEESPFRAAAAPQTAPTTTVFECDVTRVLAHRRRCRDNGAEIALTAYYVAACHAALTAVPEVAAAAGGPAPFLVALSNAEGDERSLQVETMGLASAALDELLLAIDRALREPAVRKPAATVLAVHHYGSSGCLLATPTPIAADQAASVGVARVRRQIVVRSVDGDETPRIAAVGYITLTFRPERVTLARANRYLAEVVRVLEKWPD